MATEHIPQIDKLIKDLGDKISRITGEKQRDVEEEILRLRKLYESEEKSMLHNVTVKHEENKVLEEIWVMRAVKEGKLPFDFKKTVIDERKLDHEPSKNEIAQFLSDTKADFVSVVQNYRFASELPFC